MWEVGYAQASKKPLLLIAEASAQLPFDIAHLRTVLYGDDFEAVRNALIQAIAALLSEDRLRVASELLNLNQYRGAILQRQLFLSMLFGNFLRKKI